MRYLIGFAFVSALAAAPLSASAQVGEGVTTSKQASAASLVIGQEVLLPQLVLRASYYYVYPGCPLGPRGGKCAEPTPAPAPDPLDEQRDRVRRLRAGVILSSILLAGGAAAIAGTIVAYDSDAAYDGKIVDGGQVVGFTFGSLMVAGGVVGMGISGKRLRTAKQKLKLNEKDTLESGGVHRGPGTSRFAF